MDLLEQYLACANAEAQAAFLAGLSETDLDELRTAMRTQLDSIDAEAPTTEQLAEMTALATGLQAVAARQAEVTAAEADRAAEAQRLRDEVAALDAPAGETTPPEGEPELDDEGNPIVPAEPETPPATPEGEPAAAPEGAAPVPVAAAAVAPVRAVARRAPAARPAVAATPRVAPLVASADVPGHAMGQALDSTQAIGQALLARWNTIKNAKGNTGEQVIVASATGEYPQGRQLISDATTNTARIQAFMDAFQSGDPEAIAASGGICAPETVRYDQVVMGRTDRPVRDQAMVNFGADRGGVMWVPNPRLLDVSGANPAAVGVWTAATDADPQGATKPCATFTCPEPTTAVIEAITRCLEFGNFMERTFRERVDAFLQLANVWHARYAEQRLIAAMSTGSTAVTTGQGLDAITDVLTVLDRAHASWVSYERLDENMRFVFLAPSWLRHMLRSGIARQMPFGTLDERYAVADAKIDSFFALRNIDPVWSPDMQTFPAQPTNAALNGWASTVTAYLYPRGTWAFLDGGELNLGLVRDSSLNETNDFQMFMETFEGAAKFGNQSWKLTMDLCPDGSAAALVDYDPCTTGS